MKDELPYYFYHYYEEEIGPFRSLSNLNSDEAKLILDRLKSEGKVFASQRSDDYLKIRSELEKRARSMFIAKGGKPKTAYPHYMTLGKCDWIKQWYKRGMELKIHCSEFNQDHISFTYGDLFPTMRFKDGKPYREKLYTKQEIIKIIEEYGLPQEWNKDGSKGPERYIEVQMWDDKQLMKYL